MNISECSSGRWKRFDLESLIRFKHSVRDVRFDVATRKWSVVAKDLASDVLLPAESFDYVLVCTGHFSTPSWPSVPGTETFPGT